MADPLHSNEEFVDPMPGWLLRLFASLLLLVTASAGPLWLIDRFKLFSSDTSESILFWRVAAFIGYYTLLGMALAVYFLRDAWLTWRSQRHPYPGKFVSRRSRVLHGLNAKIYAVYIAILGLLFCCLVALGWKAFQVPALLFGIGEYDFGAPADCPAGSDG